MVKKSIILCCGLGVVMAMTGCSDNNKTNTSKASEKGIESKYDNLNNKSEDRDKGEKEKNLEDSKDLNWSKGDKEFKVSCKVGKEGERIVVESLLANMQGDCDREEKLGFSHNRERCTELRESNEKEGIYETYIEVKSLEHVPKESYSNTSSEEYYKNLDSTKVIDMDAMEVVKINYDIKYTEKADKVVQYGSGNYDKYYVLVKSKNYDFRVFDIYFLGEAGGLK